MVEKQRTQTRDLLVTVFRLFVVNFFFYMGITLNRILNQIIVHKMRSNN